MRYTYNSVPYKTVRRPENGVHLVVLPYANLHTQQDVEEAKAELREKNQKIRVIKESWQHLPFEPLVRIHSVRNSLVISTLTKKRIANLFIPDGDTFILTDTEHYLDITYNAYAILKKSLRPTSIIGESNLIWERLESKGCLKWRGNCPRRIPADQPLQIFGDVTLQDRLFCHKNRFLP